MLKKRGRSGAELPLNRYFGWIMYSLRDQIEIIKSIKVKEGGSLTLDCPFCLGKRKFSITNDSGTILWNCYKASCTARGSYRKGMSLDSVKSRLDKPYVRPSPINGRTIPNILSSPTNHPYVMTYLTENGCLPAFKSGRVKVRYAPADNRCLFFMNNDQGAVGRALDNRKPKWMSYGDTTGVFSIGDSDKAVLVEDVPSACAVSTTQKYTGVAILGTSLSTKQKQILKTYAKVYICLDNDAKRKAITLLRQLQGTVECTVRFITKDLKYCPSGEITKVIEYEV